MSKYSSWLAALFFLVLAICCKLKLVPMETNFALFGALSIFCGAYLRGFAAWLLPMGGIVLSDFLGQWLQVPGVYCYDARSMLFNYAGFAAMIGIGHWLRVRDSTEFMLGTALIGSFVFFLLSNFGCWLDPLLKYDRSLGGLVSCYWMAIPYFKFTLLSDVIFTLLFVGAHRMALSYSRENARVTADH